MLEKEVEKRKVALQEAKLKAKGLNPDGTPALSTLGGFSPASKPCKVNNLSTVNVWLLESLAFHSCIETVMLSYSYFLS